jgi:very-short-patch-repair endonuclease
VAARIARIAERQHGVVGRRQLLMIGVRSSTIADWVEAGRLHRVHRGVYAVGRPASRIEGRWMAAILASPTGSLLSHGSAGQLWGLIQRFERLASHVTVPGSNSASPTGVVTHRSRSLGRRDATTRLNIPVTTVTRTVWDLATVLSPSRARRVFEQAERLEGFDRERLRALHAAAPSRRGAAVIRQLLVTGAVPISETRSRLEEILLEICRDQRIPFPAVNVPLLGYEVDFLWGEERFVVEVDGGIHLTPARRRRDNERDSVLGRAGYLVRRYDWEALADRQAVAAEVLAVLSERSRPGNP